MNILLETTFRNRGLDAAALDDLLSCSHAIPMYTEELCERLAVYHQSQELLVVLTDFDYDGICSGVIGFAGLAELGFNVSLYLPHVEDGYGFDASVIDEIKSLYPAVKGILTGDVGISAVSGIAYAKSLGLDVFVTDHHLGSRDNLQADVVVDPQQPEDTLSYSYICGANVMYQVLRYYAEYHTDKPGYYGTQIDRLRVFAGFGTISDGMPLHHENRPLVRDMVSICRMLFGDGMTESNLVNYIDGHIVYQRAFAGVRELLYRFYEAGKIQRSRDIDETFIAYYVVPMFNSVKRMDGDISQAYQVFFGGTQQAGEALDYLQDLNEKRKVLVAEYFDDLMQQDQRDQPWSPYVYLTDAPVGIRGLLAQKVLSVTGLPSFVVSPVSNHTYSGSGRCPAWFPFLDCGLPNRDWWAAGHNPAFGFGIEEHALDTFVKFLETEITNRKPSEEELAFRPDFVVSEFGDGDIVMDLDILKDYVRSLEYCRPFGSGFPEPVCTFAFSSRRSSWKVIGKEKNHLKITLINGAVILAFFQVDAIGSVIAEDGNVNTDLLPERIEMQGKWSLHEFQDVRTLQFMGTFLNLGDEYQKESEV